MKPARYSDDTIAVRTFKELADVSGGGRWKH